MPVTGEVSLHSSPWVSGTRAHSYFGPLNLHVFVADEPVASRARRPDRRVRELLADARAEVRERGGNALVGIEVEADPFAEVRSSHGTRVTIMGTVARLEPLWTQA